MKAEQTDKQTYSRMYNISVISKDYFNEIWKGDSLDRVEGLGLNQFWWNVITWCTGEAASWMLVHNMFLSNGDSLPAGGPSVAVYCYKKSAVMVISSFLLECRQKKNDRRQDFLAMLSNFLFGEWWYFNFMFPSVMHWQH